MPPQYFCKDKRRKQEVLKSEDGLNGIDYLEVVDLDYVEEFGERFPFRQRTLLVRFLKPIEAEIDADNLNIEGGVRVTPVRVQWAVVASDGDRLDELVDSDQLSANERDFLLGDWIRSDPKQVVIIRTAATGDYSTYTLQLVAGRGGSGPPEGFDELLSQVSFSFKVDCVSDFDCKVEPACPPEPKAAPVIDFLAKDYASFRQLILDRLSVIMPDWHERNPADTGIALVELLAYAGDRLSYFQDAVGTEAYLGTARRRVSVRRHARLLDYHMHDGCNARGWVQVQVDGTDVTLPTEETEFLTHSVGQLSHIARGSHAHQQALTGGAEVFKPMHEVALWSAHNEIYFYTYNDRECCLPKGATRAALRDSEDENKRLHLRIGDVLIFQEVKSPANGLPQDADLAHRHAVRLTQVNSRTDALTSEPIVEITWDVADALPFPLCISVENADDISVALGNIVLADHGRTIVDEELTPAPEPSSRSRYRPVLKETGLTYCISEDKATAQQGPAATALYQEPRLALPDIFLTGDDEEWKPRHDLLGSRRFDPHFVVELEKDGHGFLRFSRVDDPQGKVPDEGVKFKATYRIGNGLAGNVGAGAIAHIVTTESGIKRVWNPLPAQGGIDPESMDKVRLDAPQAFRIQQRAVTDEDYAEISQRHPKVQRAMATRRWTGSWHTLFITVDRKGGQPVDAEFEEELSEFLQSFRQTGHDVEIEPPEFVALHIAMTVCVDPEYFRSQVKEALLTVFSNRDLPDGRRGFFHPDSFTFGQPVYLSQVVARAMEVPGVLWVDLEDGEDKRNRFRRWGELSNKEFEAGRIEMGRLEIARLDNDPNRPENGKIEFFMEGGL